MIKKESFHAKNLSKWSFLSSIRLNVVKIPFVHGIATPPPPIFLFMHTGHMARAQDFGNAETTDYWSVKHTSHAPIKLKDVSGSECNKRKVIA